MADLTGMMQAAAGAAETYDFFLNFENTTISNSIVINNIGITVITSNGSLVTTDSPYEGSKHLYNDTRTSPGNRVLFGFPVTQFNSANLVKIEFYWKLQAQDSFASTFDLAGSTTAERIFFRSNRSGTFASGIGGATTSNNTGWCTWANYNKFTIAIDLAISSNNATIAVNDAVKQTGTVNQTWSAFSGSNIYLSFYQLADAASNDNGVSGWLDNVSITLE
jgi:hypothetical protein